MEGLEHVLPVRPLEGTTDDDVGILLRQHGVILVKIGVVTGDEGVAHAPDLKDGRRPVAIAVRHVQSVAALGDGAYLGGGGMLLDVLPDEVAVRIDGEGGVPHPGGGEVKAVVKDGRPAAHRRLSRRRIERLAVRLCDGYELRGVALVVGKVAVLRQDDHVCRGIDLTE